MYMYIQAAGVCRLVSGLSALASRKFEAALENLRFRAGFETFIYHGDIELRSVS